MVVCKRHLLASLVLVILALEGLVVGSFYWTERATLRANQNGVKKSPKADHYWYPFPAPGVRQPAVVAAEQAGLGAGEEVIGVEVAGKARAYRLEALRDRNRHIINDLIDGVPVSVAYCNFTDCVRVYTDPRGRAPLDVAVAGLYDGEMAVRLGGTLYLHKSGAALKPGTGSTVIPYDLLSPTRTTWREWTQRHPGTDVYEGDGARERP